MTWQSRYKAAYEHWQYQEYEAARTFGPLSPNYPKVSTANGLTQMICNFLKWEGHRATRIQTQGQFVTEKYAGCIVSSGFRTSSTRKGTADISATIRGRAVMLEIKVGNDRPSVHQLEEQKRERAAGGVYEFIHTPEEFLSWYDSFIIPLDNSRRE